MGTTKETGSATPVGSKPTVTSFTPSSCRDFLAPIKQYMKMKRKARLNPKDLSPKSDLPSPGVKEKLEALEMERRARLRIEHQISKYAHLRRPTWDSSISSSVHGNTETSPSPWSNVSDPATAAAEFPLPKARDSCEFTFPCDFNEKTSPESTPRVFAPAPAPASKPKKKSNTPCNPSNLNVLQAKKDRTSLSGLTSSRSNSARTARKGERNDNFGPQQRSGNTKQLRKQCSCKARQKNGAEKRNSCSKCGHGNISETGNPSLSNKKSRFKQNKPPPPGNHKQTHPYLKRAKQMGVQSVLYSDMNSRTHISNLSVLTVQKSALMNKKKNLDMSSKVCKIDEGRPLRMQNTSMTTAPLSSELETEPHSPTSTYTNYNDLNQNSSKGVPYVTYHLEKFPTKCKVEVLTDKKRVALLKVLAQQLVNRIDAAKWSSSVVDMSRVKEQAFSLKRSLTKVQKQLSTIEKSLEGDTTTSSRKKVSGYIVLPSKLHLAGSRSVSRCTSADAPTHTSCSDTGLGMQDTVSHASSSGLSLQTSFSGAYDVMKREFANRKESLGQGSCGKLDSDYELKSHKRQEEHTRKSSIEDPNSWDHRNLLQELEKLDAEIRETKTRMATKLAHSSIAERDSIRSSLRSSMRSSIEGNPLSMSFVETLETIPSPSIENLQQNLAHSTEEMLPSPAEQICRSYNDESTTDKISLPEHELRDNSGNCMIDGYGSSFGLSNRTERDIVSVSSSFSELYNGTILDDSKRTDDVLGKHGNRGGDVTEFITDSLMQELLDNGLSVAIHEKQCRVFNNNPIDALETGIQASQDDASEDDTMEPIVAAREPSQTDATCAFDEVQTTYQETDNKITESFKTICKKWVAKYVNKTLDAEGAFESSQLMSLYVTEDSSSTLAGVATDNHGNAGNVYSKLLHDAIFESLDKQYTRFSLPSFFLYQQPCPEGPRLKQMVVSRVNEQADAACEGGLSLENILERSLDEEDWKHSYCNMMGIVSDVSDELLQDIIDEFIFQEMNSKQSSSTRIHSPEWSTLYC